MTKKNILKIAIPSAIAIAAAAIFCGSYYNADDRCYNCGAQSCPEGTTCSACGNDNCPNVIGKSRFCTHPIDQEYTEPTVKPGKYYLNGDINSCYMEVTENTWQIITTEDCDFHTLKQLGTLAFIKETMPDQGINTDEIIDIDDDVSESIIAFYSVPHEYTVTTWHAFDIVWLSPGQNELLNVPPEYRQTISAPQKYYQDGAMVTQGPQLKDENTLTEFGVDFILVE